MPRPAEPGRYIAGLDGLRAVAVLAVIVYHLGLGWASGGLLGVGVFFTLSGYLITDLLLGHWQRSASFGLTDFWVRRARRLLPALVVMLSAVTLWVAVDRSGQLAALGGDVFAAAVYGSNWWLIFHHVSYFAQFGPPSPLGHLWSLAVEEQFYLLWPWLLLIGVRLVPDRRSVHGARPRLALVTLAAAGGSAALMAVLYHPGLDPTRVYDGTDTRAFSLLIGAALALRWPSRRFTRPSRPAARGGMDVLGFVGLAGIGLLVWRTQQYSAFLYPGGMLLLAFATAAVVLAVVCPGTAVGAALGWKPLRWLGERSYGIYLWHYPVIVLTTPRSAHGFDPARAALQVGGTVLVSALSWRWIEQPVRSGAFGRANLSGRTGAYLRRARRYGGAVSAGWLVALAPTGLVLAAVAPGGAAGAAALGSRFVATMGPPASSHATTATTIPTTTSTTVAAGPPRASCPAVAHLGDSTSDSLVSPDYLPDPAQRITAQYADVGATTQEMEIYGGNSIVEHLSGEPSGYEIAQQLVSQGFHGCWVIALGTNDAADIAVGSEVGADARIQRMMSAIGDQPVLWVQAVTQLGSGPYANSNMVAWDQALAHACAAYPSMRVYDWASVAQPAWFLSDGVHYSSAGSAVRAQDIATAMAEAFPASGPPPPGCEVH